MKKKTMEIIKYHTIGSSNTKGDGKKSTLTIYADLGLKDGNEKTTMESEVCRLRDELLQAQTALNRQTRRCRELVEEFTRKLQETDLRYEIEKKLREDQLGKLLRALLLVEARLRQEQKIIRNQLKEKDFLIAKQENDIKKLTTNFCKNCNQLYNNFESLESSSLELDSSSEYYYSIYHPELKNPSSENSEKAIFQKNSVLQSKKLKKTHPHRKSIGTYFEVLKIRNESPFSNEDNTSNDYDNFDSLPPESVNDDEVEIKENEENDESIKEETHSNDVTVIENEDESRVPENLTVFEVEEETNDKWYVNGSDYEENSEKKNIYRNNPVLECVNQILLRNIDTNSPPETPETRKKISTTTTKKVKFNDENQEIDEKDTKSSNYYETPIQKLPNHYESPQSIYSNDYEQISSRKSFVMTSPQDFSETSMVKKTKILRTPPALPPKPTKLLSKYKLTTLTSPLNNCDNISLDSEPTYCSISELNLPPVSPKKIQVIAEINTNETKNDEMIIKNVENNLVKIAKQVNVESSTNKSSSDIPKLPLVSEIIIPEDEEKKLNATTTQDNYIKNNTQIMKSKIVQNRRPISIGSSVSSLIMGFNNRDMLESKLKPISPKKNSEIINFPESKNPIPNDFNLNQNFEEFKLDECEIEEYETGNEEVKNVVNILENPETTEKNEILVPNLNKKSLELLKQHLELEKEKQHKSDIHTNNFRNNLVPNYEHFLECTGLSSKSILNVGNTGNNRTVLRPRDVKLRSKNRNSNCENVKYWTEPFI